MVVEGWLAALFLSGGGGGCWLVCAPTTTTTHSGKKNWAERVPPPPPTQLLTLSCSYHQQQAVPYYTPIAGFLPPFQACVCWGGVSWGSQERTHIRSGGRAARGGGGGGIERDRWQKGRKWLQKGLPASRLCSGTASWQRKTAKRKKDRLG